MRVFVSVHHKLRHQMTTISQEYFDEVCVENQELFDLTEEEAVEETIKQLCEQQQTATTGSSSSSIQGTATPPNRKALSHLSLTFPNENNQGIRDRRERLRKVVEDDLHTNKDTELLSRSILESEQDRDFLISLNIVGKLTSAWTGQPHITQLLLLLLRTSNRESLPCFQDNFKPSVWMTAFAGGEESTVCTTLEDKISFLQLACFSVRQNEDKKKAWMNTKIGADHGKGIVDILFSVLSTHLEEREILEPCCRFISLLCTFDDFRSNNSQAPKISTAHDNVQAFYRAKFVPILITLMDENSPAASLALRAMAIHDEIIQAMIAFGILGKAKTLMASSESTEILTNMMGLFRNLSANDQIKTSLCLGEMSIVASMHDVSEKYPDEALLQEHMCGTIAAMALRQPKNAEFLVNNGLHTTVFKAMRKFPQRSTLQRQGALAIRNLGSRSPHLRIQIINDGAEEVLRSIAAGHLDCQDEVYAALRDLGLRANMVEYTEDPNGNVVVKTRQMFGEKNPNFRAVYE